MKHILIPIDGSQTALRAVKEGAELQEKFAARITLLYVVADPRKEGLIQGAEATRREEVVGRERGEAALAEAKACFLDKAAVESMLVTGVVSRTIEKIADEGPYDYMIMGTQGMGSALKRFLLGSVTKHVLEHVTIPVLVVR